MEIWENRNFDFYKLENGSLARCLEYLDADFKQKTGVFHAVTFSVGKRFVLVWSSQGKTNARPIEDVFWRVPFHIYNCHKSNYCDWTIREGIGATKTSFYTRETGFWTILPSRLSKSWIWALQIIQLRSKINSGKCRWENRSKSRSPLANSVFIAPIPSLIVKS